MSLETYAEDAVKIYVELFPFIQKYGMTALEVFKTLLESNVHPSSIDKTVLQSSIDGIEKANQEVQTS